jgi:glycosyltransferase involved in cell wall biosynthesis
MSSGCLPVATAVGGVPEVLSDPDLGWVVSLDDEAQLRQALRMAIEHVLIDNGSLSHRVREHVRTRFGLRQQMAALVRLVETL